MTVRRAGLAGLVVTRVRAWAFPGDRVLVRVDANGGGSGWGDAAPGESAAEIAASIDERLAPVLLGRPAWDVDGIGHRCARAAPDAVRARGAVDIALHDLLGRAAGVPVGVLWGARRGDQVPALGQVAGLRPSSAAEFARAVLDDEVSEVVVDAGVGPTEALRICALAEDFRVPLLGIASDSPLGTITALHLCAAHDVGLVGAGTGAVNVPTGPGLGVPMD
jgi:L-alanine-DL-glutamate epimerase-like enolase superfamily enzyme